MFPFRLGPFDVTSLLGEGGHAEVFRAVHRALRLPVALKVLQTGGRAAGRTEELGEMFRNEARAVAALDHPHIVSVLDVGEVTRAAERASGRRVRAGAPWLVMELAEGGTLRDRRAPIAWPELARLLRALLSALAHAHARGVIHRDLKPSNVLDGGFEPGPKLADFGIATVLDAGAPGARAGTPAFMAPEQLGDGWAPQSGATDLYGLGCLAWTLVAGEPPFGDLRAVGQASLVHRTWPLPPFKPRVAVPAGFEEWLRHLLEKRPERRPACAADAAIGLDRVDGPEVAIHAPERAPAPMAADTVAASEEPPGPRLVLDGPPDVRRGRPKSPPLPEDPRLSEHHRTAPPPLGPKLRSHRLRPPPFVGRGAEQRALWGALREVAASGCARAVTLEGPAGQGKSRLARWLCELVEETGTAAALRATHGPTPGAAEGLGAMIARRFGCLGAPREEARRCLAELGGVLAAEALELVAPGDRGHAVRPEVERSAVLTALLEHLTRERPVIVWIDDAQWAPEGLALCEALLARPLPVLFVLTLRSDALAERPAEAARVAEICARPGVARVELAPLATGACTELVQSLLWLDPTTAARAGQRSGGNPLFAVEIVTDWVQQRMLKSTPRGFRLRREGDAVLPDDLHHTWCRRVDRALAGRPEDDGPALEIAAILGPEVIDEEWRAACERAAVRPSAALVAALVAQRLAAQTTADRGRWAFAHGMLRESLERRAREGGRLAAHHRACAAMLRGARGAPERAARAAHHLLEGERPEEALPLLIEAAQDATVRADVAAAERLLARAEHLFARLGRPDGDPLRGEVLLCKCRLAGAKMSGPDVLASARAALAEAERRGFEDTCCAILVELGRGLLMRGRAAEAVRVLADAYERALAAAPARLSWAAFALGAVRAEIGDMAGARPVLEEACRLFDERGDPYGLGTARWALGKVLLKTGDAAGALDHAEAAHALLLSVGARIGLRNACCLAGDAELALGHPHRAERRFHDALDVCARAVPPATSVVPRVKLALLHLDRGDHHAALALIDGLERIGVESGIVWYSGFLYAVQIACAALRGDAEALGPLGGALEAFLSKTGFIEPDLARPLEIAAATQTPGADERARLLRLAAAQWRALGRLDDAARCEEAARRPPPTLRRGASARGGADA